MTKRVCVGAVAGSFGVRGEIRLKSFCSDPAAIGTYTPLTDEEGERQFDLKITRQIKNGFAARVSGVASKEAADALRGTRLYTARENLPGLDEEEFYHADLIGLTVLDTGGRELGTVKAVLNHGASDLLEIRAPGARQPVLLPFTKVVVPTIDLASGRIIADPPDGLFDDTAEA